jgi:hypothetical protein
MYEKGFGGWHLLYDPGISEVQLCPDQGAS